MDEKKAGHLELKALLFLPTLIACGYLASLSSQFTCFYFGHHICGGYSLEEIPAQMDFVQIFTADQFGLSGFFPRALLIVATTMVMLRFLMGRWVPFKIAVLLSWALLFGFYETHFVVFGDLPEWLLPPETTHPVIAYPLGYAALFSVFILIPALPLVLMNLLIERSRIQHAAE